MKKKILILILSLVTVVVFVYFYAYQGHRNIATETPDYSIKIIDLQKEFLENDSLAYKKYQDKTIETSGTITNVDIQSKGIVIDEKLFATFKEVLPKEVSVGMKVKIKGRFLGYDDLLEEFKIDQISIIE